jgi:alpha-L-rhamnosidase
VIFTIISLTGKMIANRVTLTQDPFVHLNADRRWNERGRWPCSWIACPGADMPPFISAYRRRFMLDHDSQIRVHITADERYILYIDGEQIGRGSERGDEDHWFYESYDLSLAAGPHVIVAKVWSLGKLAPYAQISVHPGFLLASEGEFADLLGTGLAAWEAKRLPGYIFTSPGVAWGTGGNLIVDGRAVAWGVERGESEGWQPATTVNPGIGAHEDYSMHATHWLRPSTLPAMLDTVRQTGSARLISAVSTWDTQKIAVHPEDHLTESGWQDLLDGHSSITIPPHTGRRVIIDLEEYYCSCPELVTTGGAGSSIRLRWAESLFIDPEGQTKGNRDSIDGKYFVGVGDSFLPDGGTQRRFDTLWWQAGRYLELLVLTSETPLTIEHFALRETRYPLEMESRFSPDDSRLSDIIPIMLRGLQMCAHETYMDCPYYEQLMYAGDTRLEILTTYVITRDDRLPRKALRLFDASRQADGLTRSCYPSRVRQVIPPFSLWWITMVCDYAYWRGDLATIRDLMPGVRATMEGFRHFLGADGLIHAPDGWNYMDWVPAWTGGIPPHDSAGISVPVNWQLALVQRMLADLEDQLGEPELAARNRRQAVELANTLSVALWDDQRGLFADDPRKQHFSEHSQCLAILSGLLDPAVQARVAQGLLHYSDLERTTIYFTHYLFETYRVLGRMDVLFERLSLWFDLKAQGFKTPIEHPEPSRSDCHAWGAHPLYHYFASILGIRPTSLGFRTVEIAPQLGPMQQASGMLVHPNGEIHVDFRVEGDSVHGSITLPQGLSGVFRANGSTYPLHEGINTL